MSLQKMGSKNPNFRKKLPEKTRKRMSVAKKGGNDGSFKKGERRSIKTEFKKGQIPHNKGKKTGLIPWNKGKKGQKPWNKGKKTGLIPWNKGKILVPLDEQRKKTNQRAREKYAKDLEKSRKKGRAFYQRHREKELKRHKASRIKFKDVRKQRIVDLKLEVYSHYSKLISNSDVPVCACIGCGVKHIEFLTLDHMFGRKSMGSVFDTTGDKLWRRLKRDSYPVGIQVLCWNCNSAKSNNPFCPVHEWYKYHQKESRR